MDIENALQNLESMPFSEEKVILTENMFHITIWNMMNFSQRVHLLQLLEDNLSCRDGRAPNKIEIFLKMPNLASASLLTGKIRISQWHLECGFNDLSDLNAQTYSAICHEHEHFNQFIDAKNDKADKKTDECRANLKHLIPYSDSTVQGYVEYRLQPTEYYAHKLSEEQTVATFIRLEREFGEDKGFKEWYELISAVTVEGLVQIYNQEYGTEYTFDELYANVFNKITVHEKGPKL